MQGRKKIRSTTFHTYVMLLAGGKDLKRRRYVLLYMYSCVCDDNIGHLCGFKVE